MDLEEIIDIFEENKVYNLPNNMIKIIYLLNKDYDYNINDVIKIIEESENFKEYLLNLINSGYFKTTHKITSIKEVFILLGSGTIKNLIISLLIKSLLMKGDKKTKLFNKLLYWNHCIGVSVASELISQKNNLYKPYELFPYGLVHDIGMILLEACIPDFYGKVMEQMNKGASLLEAERNLLDGLTHTEIGAMYCGKLNFPEDIVNSIKYHHYPELSPIDTMKLQILNLADYISFSSYTKHLGYHPLHPIGANIPKNLLLKKYQLKEIYEELPIEVRKTKYLLQVSDIRL